MGVRNLNRAEEDDQKNAEEREENSPGMVGAKSLVCVTHIRNYTNGAGSLFVVR